MGFWKNFDLHCRIYEIDPGDTGTRQRRRALNHFNYGYFFDYGDLIEIADRLEGEVRFGMVVCPAPGAPPNDRSMVVKINPARPHDFYVYACPEALTGAAEAYIRERLELPDHEPEELVIERIARALDVWKVARPPEGTLVETYLRSRRLSLPPRAVIRFHPDLYHADAQSRWPAMVALVTDVNDEPTGVHLTYLARDGLGKAPLDREQQRRTMGLIKGNGIRLAAGEGRLLVGEGIETVLTVHIETGRSACAVGGAKLLASLRLPDNVRDVTILVDGDDAGRLSAREAASAFGKQGRSVVLAEAPEGKDFNDLLMEETPHG